MRLLVGVDGRDGGRDALELARLLASGSDGEVETATVLYGGPLPLEYAELDPEEATEAAPILEDARTRLAGVPATHAIFGGGSAAAILMQRAEDAEQSDPFDAIVAGSPHRGRVGRVLIGSVANGLLSGSPVDVFVAPRGYAQERRPDFRRIAIGFDGSPESEAALRRAEALARSSNAALDLLTVVRPAVVYATPGGGGYAPPTPSDPEETIAEAVRSADSSLAVHGRRLDGDPGREILAVCEAEEPDLLVVGSRGYGPVMRVLLGSVSRKAIADAPCPVMVVRRP